MTGPAAQLWARRFPDVPTAPSLEAALDGAGALLSGTGWGPVQQQARARARSLGLRTAAVVDHWVNYRARFVEDGAFQPPDEVWVTDAHALAIARSCLPGVPVRQLPNPYLEEQVARITPLAADAPPSLLYVLEPQPNRWGGATTGEFQALDYLVDHLDVLGLGPSTPLRLRPHPTDPAGKYDAWIARQQGLDVDLDESADLAEAIGRVSYVAGCETYAMVIALAAGRKVVCTLPPWAPECTLPHDGLIHLKKISRAR
jgi:hypothetical protein